MVDMQYSSSCSERETIGVIRDHEHDVSLSPLTFRELISSLFSNYYTLVIHTYIPVA